MLSFSFKDSHQQHCLLRNMIIESNIEHGGVRPFFHMVDRYFGNNLLEPFESKFIGSTGLTMAYLWLSWPSLMTL